MLGEDLPDASWLGRRKKHPDVGQRHVDRAKERDHTSRPCLGSAVVAVAGALVAGCRLKDAKAVVVPQLRHGQAGRGGEPAYEKQIGHGR